MDLDLQWLLIGLPVAFALGWLASRMDLQAAQAGAR
jgi:lipopolysaccharide biosynthesis regulator YciM